MLRVCGRGGGGKRGVLMLQGVGKERRCGFVREWYRVLCGVRVSANVCCYSMLSQLLRLLKDVVRLKLVL